MPARAHLTRRPTIADVARAAEVSKGAVSFALNGRPGVAEHTRARILAVAAELGWAPSASARSLSTRRALAVGLVVAREAELLGADPFFPPFIAGIETVLAPRGQALVLQVALSPAAELDGYRRLAADGRVDGVFLSDLRVTDPRPALLRELGLPAVTLGRTPKQRLMPAVTIDDRAGITDAVRHLAELGHRRIAHVAGPQHFVHGRGRKSAWRAAVAAAGLPTDLSVTADFTASGGAKATAKLLDLSDPPTAIVYANDVMAIAGMSLAAARGLSVPDELSVTGFDDTELARHLRPALTTVRSDPMGWGAAAATLLLDAIDLVAETRPGRPDSPDVTELADVDLPPAQLVIRQTSAPPPRPPRRTRTQRATPSPTRTRSEKA
ncbi:MAG: LacI family DNA-binding transcriptional regulator [Actinomycetes bacterium]